MPLRPDLDALLAVLAQLSAAGELPASSAQLAHMTGASLATTKRLLDAAVQAGRVVRTGQARATRYSLPAAQARFATPPWSASALELRAALAQPLGARAPVTYRREFVDRYVPNESSLLPRGLAQALAAEGRMQGQQPAGTYARKVLEQLLIDLSWSSSRLEGNRYSLLATQDLFKSGATTGDPDAIMLLNHKRAIEFLVDAVPQYGLTAAVVRNVHAVLMQDLLPDVESLGAIRQKIVRISDTTYLPTQVPSLLGEMFETVIDRARHIHNPLEAAFFLWVQFAYLQPFEDGNKRTSRLAANIPLMLFNCAPLSFLDVDPQDYALAMMGVYEFLDASLAIDLFAWTYRRSVAKYAVVLASMGAPDPMRLRWREALNDALHRVVRQGQSAAAALSAQAIPADQAPGFERMLLDELNALDVHNCGRYRLPMGAVEAWVAAGRRR